VYHWSSPYLHTSQGKQLSLSPLPPSSSPSFKLKTTLQRVPWESNSRIYRAEELSRKFRSADWGGAFGAPVKDVFAEKVFAEVLLAKKDHGERFEMTTLSN
jgi:hypothetical protein